jgi:hypothetical protein
MPSKNQKWYLTSWKYKKQRFYAAAKLWYAVVQKNLKIKFIPEIHSIPWLQLAKVQNNTPPLQLKKRKIIG